MICAAMEEDGYSTPEDSHEDDFMLALEDIMMREKPVTAAAKEYHVAEGKLRRFSFVNNNSQLLKISFWCF